MFIIYLSNLSVERVGVGVCGVNHGIKKMGKPVKCCETRHTIQKQALQIKESSTAASQDRICQSNGCYNLAIHLYFSRKRLQTCFMIHRKDPSFMSHTRSYSAGCGLRESRRWKRKDFYRASSAG